MPAVGRGVAGRPKSLVEHLNDQAPKRAVNDIVSITRYLMSARLLLNQVRGDTARRAAEPWGRRKGRRQARSVGVRPTNCRTHFPHQQHIRHCCPDGPVHAGHLVPGYWG